MTAHFTKSKGNSSVSILIYDDGATTQKCQRVMYIGSDYVRIPGRDIAELEMWPEGEEAMLEHKRKARSISARIAKQMDAVANANTKAKRKFISVVLSFAKSERFLENEPLKLDDIVRKWLNGMGYKDAQYYAVYHYDSGAPHVHVCVNLIDYFTHKAYDRYNDEYRSQKVCRQIEAEYGLSVGKGINKDEKLEAKTALGKERKTIIQAARDIIAGGVNSEKQYIEKMKERGITVKVVHHANCRDGYSYRIGRGKPHPGYLLSPELTMRSITDQINRCLNISAGMDKEESLAQEQQVEILQPVEQLSKNMFDFKAALTQMIVASCQPEEKTKVRDIDLYGIMMSATDKYGLDRSLLAKKVLLKPVLDRYKGVEDFRISFFQEGREMNASKLVPPEQLRSMLNKWERLTWQAPAYKLEIKRRHDAELAAICKTIDHAFPQHAPRTPKSIFYRQDGTVSHISYCTNAGKLFEHNINPDGSIRWNDGYSYNIRTGKCTWPAEIKRDIKQEQEQEQEQLTISR